MEVNEARSSFVFEVSRELGLKVYNASFFF